MPTCTSRTVVRLAIEYLLITLPIVIYASLEALHEGSVAPLLHWPEGSIATIFLAFQTVRLFVDEQVAANIHWTSDALADFLKRRLEDHLKIKHRSFVEVWREFFPDKSATTCTASKKRPDVHRVLRLPQLHGGRGVAVVAKVVAVVPTTRSPPQ